MATIAVAGATGNLGGRIIKALVARGADVRALVRAGTPAEKVAKVEALGAKVVKVDLGNVDEVTQALQGVEGVVSALQGLRDVIVDTQSTLLDAAVRAGVKRFIPSDYSSDFTQQATGENRNFDLRREFHQRLDKAPIASTSILNGAFGEVLTYNAPFLDLKKKSVGYIEDPDFRVDFTTMDDVAAFTAAAALDASAPKVLRIASFQISAKEMVALATELSNSEFKLVPMGNRASAAAYNKRERAAHPEGEKELMPTWQRSQYMLSMFSARMDKLDNDRYPNLKWTRAKDVVAPLFSRG